MQVSCTIQYSTVQYRTVQYSALMRIIEQVSWIQKSSLHVLTSSVITFTGTTLDFCNFSQPQYASIFRHAENAPTSTFSLCLLVLEESMKQTCIYLKLGHLSAKILTFNLSHCRGQQVQLPAQRAVRHLDPADPLHAAAGPGRVPVPSQH